MSGRSFRPVRAIYIQPSPHRVSVDGGGVAWTILRSWQQSQVATLARSRKELAQRIRALKHRAFSIGYKNGLRTTLKRAVDSGMSQQESFRKITRIANKECLELVLGICREILREEHTSNITAIGNRVVALLEDLEYRTRVYLLAHHTQKSALRALLASLGYDIEVESSAEVRAGEAHLKTPAGTVVISWIEELAQLETRLHMELEQLTGGESVVSKQP